MVTRNAFTLIEFLVVILIIGMLLGLLLPSINPKRDPLSHHIFYGDLVRCKKIIEEGKVKPKEFPKYLQKSVSFGHLNLVRYFVEDLKTPIDDKELFIYAVWGGNREVVDYLLEKGVVVDATIKTKSEGWTLLHVAALKGYVDICKMAIEKGADKEVPNGNKNTPLEIALSQGHTDVLYFLINSGVKFDVKAKNIRNGKTLLHFAAAGGNGDLCQYLLERGADLNSKDQKGAQPIHDAAGAESPDACKVLIDAGADIDAKYNFMEGYDFAPVDSALYSGRTKSFKLLFEAGAKYDIYKKQIGQYNGNNVLMIAASEGDVELAKILVDRGMDLKECYFGKSLLHLAAEKGHADFCRWLLENGEEVDARDSNGNTPLLMVVFSNPRFGSVSRNHIETCRVLLEAGANPQTTNKQGISPINIAESESKMPDNKELLELLKTKIHP